MSGNTLAGKIGKSQNYVAVRLRDEKPFTLDDVELISDVLAGGDAGGFINYAVDEYIGYIAARQSSTPPHPSPADDGVVVDFPATQPPPPALTEAAARQVDERPEWEAMHQWDDVGEETQVRDDEDEGE